MNKIKEIFEKVIKIIKADIKALRNRIKEDKKRRATHDRLIIKAQLIEQFEPMLLDILTRSMNDYRIQYRQNHFTIQCTHDLMKVYKVKLKEFINY